MSVAEMFAEIPPEPVGFAQRVHTGPAALQGCVPRYLLDGHQPLEQTFGPLEVEYPQHSVKRSCDVVVIGSGAGGAVIAKESAERGLDVIVLEEGDLFTRESFTGSPITRFVKMARDGGTTATVGRAIIPIPLGRTVGGTTTINSGTCFRAPRKVLDAWERSGLDGVGYDAMDPWFREVEEVLSVKPVPWELLGPNGWIADAGAAKLGLTGGPLMRNITRCHGTGQCAFGCPTDAKQAMHLSYLPRAVHAGATVYARTRARWIVMDRDRAVGVIAKAYDASGRSLGDVQVSAKTVVVSAGAIGTPLLLQKNRLGISSALGSNLRIHPAVGLAGWFRDAVHGWRGTLQQYYIDTLFDLSDVMIESTNALPSVAFSTIAGHGLEAKETMARSRYMASIGFLVSDTSKGKVRVAPGGEPVITYQMNDHDLKNVSAGMALVAEVLLAAGADEVSTNIAELPAVYDAGGLEKLRRGKWRPDALKLSAFHPMGTARMGMDPSSSVVDPAQRVHGVDGLMVADASVFPSCIGVNPQMTIMAFAARAADMLAERFA